MTAEQTKGQFSSEAVMAESLLSVDALLSEAGVVFFIN
jgi:hypothetical protein